VKWSSGHVDRIAVAAERRRNETEIEGELHALGQKAAQLEESGSRIVRERVPRAFGRLDDRSARGEVRIQIIRQRGQIRHR
jgi:hypothetical protein